MIRARPAPSSMPTPLLHFTLDPGTCTPVCCSQDCKGQPGLQHMVESLSANRCTVNRASHAMTPSTDTTNGEKDAWRACAAWVYFLFFLSQLLKALHSLSWGHMTEHQCQRHEHQTTPHFAAATHPSPVGFHCSTQHNTSYVKKLIEDNNNGWNHSALSSTYIVPISSYNYAIIWSWVTVDGIVSFFTSQMKEV